MTDANTPGPRRGGMIRKTIASAPWVRTMRFVVAAIAAFLVYHAAIRFQAGNLAPTDSWMIAMIATLGASALVEAVWPEGDHGLLQFWTLTTISASALVSWAAGGQNWLGVIGAGLLAISFLIAAGVSAGRRAIDAA